MKAFWRDSAAVILSGVLALALLPPATAQELAPRQSFVDGVQKLDDGDYDGAIQSLTQATTEDPGFEPAWFYLGQAQWRAGNLQEGINAFQHALTLVPDRPGTRFYIGQILEVAGPENYELAMQQYQDELRLRRGRDVAEVLNALGRVYCNAGRQRDAIATLEHCILLDPQFVEVYYNLGRAQDARGYYDEAIKTFHKAKDILTDWQDLLARLQRLAEEHRRDPAITEETVSQKYSRAEQFAVELQLWPDLNLALGDAEDHRGEYANARNAYRESIDPNQGGNRDDPLAHTKIGLAYLHDAQDLFFRQNLIFQPVGVLKTAEETFELAIKLDDSFAPAYNGLGEVYLMQANNFIDLPARGITSHTYAEAEEEFRKALKYAPEYTDAMLSLGRALLGHAQSVANEVERGGEPEADPAALRAEAIAQLQQALTLEPYRADIRGELGWAYVDAGNLEEGRQEALQALQFDKTEVTAYFAAGLAAYYSGDLAEAAGYFSKAVELEPARYESHRFLGDALFQLQSYGRARDEYRLALKYLPEAQVTNTARTRADTLYWIALTYSNTGLHERAIESLNEALILDPEFFNAQRQLAREYAAQKNFLAAAQALRRAAQEAPSDLLAADVYVQLGELHEAGGKPHEAIAAYTQALMLDPNHEGAQRGLERLGPVSPA